MKYRTAKKKIHRFITPLIKDFPATNHLNEGYRNITLLNGYVHDEGCKISEQILSMPAEIKIQATVIALKEILANYRDVLIRITPTNKGAYLRMRLLVR